MIDVQQQHPKPTALGLADPHTPGVVLEPLAGNRPLIPPVADEQDSIDESRGAHRRRRWFARGRVDELTVADVDRDTMDLPAVQGPIVRSKAGKARRGWYAPTATPAPTTTRQAEILNTALIAAPTDDEGVVVGRDRCPTHRSHMTRSLPMRSGRSPAPTSSSWGSSGRASRLC